MTYDVQKKARTKESYKYNNEKKVGWWNVPCAITRDH